MTWKIAWYEFRVTIKRPTYLILTLGMPFFALLYVGVIALVGIAAAPAAMRTMQEPIALVDRAGLFQHLPPSKPMSQISSDAATQLANAPPEKRLQSLQQFGKNSEAITLSLMRDRLRPYSDLDAALKDLNNSKVAEVLVIEPEYVDNGAIDHYTRKWRVFSAANLAPAIQAILSDAIMYRGNLTQEQVRRTKSLPSVRVFERQSSDQYAEVNKLQRGIDIGVPVAVVVIMMFALLINAGFLSIGIAEEKENKVLEVLFSSVDPRELLMGKMLGLGGAAMLQLLVWLAMTSVFPLLLMTAMRQQVPVNIPAGLFFYGAAFFILGFFFYGALLLGFGALGNNLKESQQLAVFVVLIPMLPSLMMIPLILESGDSAITRFLSFIPFFSPALMMIRLGIRSVAPVELWSALLILVVSTWLAIVFSARLFKVGMLLSGKSPNPLNVIRMFFNQ